MKNKKLHTFITSILLTLCACQNTSNTYTVTFNKEEQNHLEYIYDSTTATSQKDYTMSFKIEYTYELQIDDIHVYFNGKENNECWTFLYQTNVKNVFTIKKEYIKSDFEIKAIAKPRTSTQSEYGYEIGNEISEICDVRFWDNRQPKWIPTLDQTAYPVMEDEAIEVIISLKAGVELNEYTKLVMDNIWFRTNARFAKLGVDFFKKYSEDGRTCTINVPNYIIRDHGSFRVNINNVLEN